MGKFLKENFVLILIIAAAFFFRFALIGSLPGGLFPDEAANGIDANAILGGDLAPFYERGNGREALFFYLLAAVVGIFGRGPWQHHVVSGGLGFLEVVAAYFLTKRLFGKNVALVASLLMAVSSYHVTLSRTAFRAILIPLFTTLTLLFLVKVYQERDTRKRVTAAILGGLSFAGGFYTYIAYRMMIPLAVFFKGVLVVGTRDRLKAIISEYWKFSVVGGIAFLAAIFPLARYFIINPGSFVGRAGHVSIFSPDLNNGDVLGTFWEVFKLTMLGFFTHGDTNWRHNVAGFPFFDGVTSVFFAIGLIVFTISSFRLLGQIWRKDIQEKTFYQTLIAALFWAMLAPEVTTAEGIPHGLRLIGVIPAMFIMAAWAMVEAWNLASKYVRENWRIAIAVPVLAFIVLYNFILYFDVAANSPEYYYAFRSDLTGVSRYLEQRNLRSSTYLSLDKFSVQTVDYLTTTTNQPYILLDPAHTYEVELKPRDQVIFTMSTLYDRIKFVEHHPDARLVRMDQNRFGQTTMLIYEQP